MRSLVHVLAGEGPAGSALPEILPPLTRRNIKLRRGQCTLLAAQPNGGKSLMALWYAVANAHHVTTLFFSADTDERTTLYRAAAQKLGRTVDEIEAMVGTSAQDIVEDAIEQLQEGVRFCFEPSPTLEDISMEIDAWEELYGTAAFPDLIVVDNLMNVVGGHENEWSAMRETMAAMHHIARTTGSCVLVLHHVSEGDSRPHMPAPRKAIQGKVSQLPEQILTVAIEPKNGIFRVAAVKNRHGHHDATGEDYETLYVDASRMTLYASQQELSIAATRRQWEDE